MNLVLCYHHVSPIRTLHNTTPEQFARHVEVLRTAGYAFVDHAEFAALARRRFPTRAKTALVTFDDGHADNWFHARPLLASLDVPAVLFAITNPLAIVEGPPRSASEEPTLEAGPRGEHVHTAMRWSELQAWKATGMLSIQSHTHSHGQFSNFKGTASELRNLIVHDLEQVQEMFRQRLGSQPTSLAWPWGYSNPVLRSAAAAMGFGLQFSTVPGYNGPWAVPQRLHRICLDGATPEIVEAWALRSGARRAAKLYSLARAGITAARGHLKSLQWRSFGTAR
jgi:peptidoglycan/xylan/chitin deacetylase (PgdA/CDA1 family)